MRTDPHHEALKSMENAQRQAGHVATTRESYCQWVVRYREARMEKHCRDLQGFLTRLSTVEKVSPKTVKQALNALKFYHEKVLKIEIPPNSLTVPKINPNRNIPVFLTDEEARDLLSRMTGQARLQGEMLYGTGGRITALLTLRLKDLDLQKGLVTFRWDKGGKSRTVRLPRQVMPRLMAHISAVRLLWESDRNREIIYPFDDGSLMKKLGKKRLGTLPFCYLFPSRDSGRQVINDVECNVRWHASDKAISDGMKKAAEEAGIMKRVSPHTLRHSNATALLDLGENIRTIQEHLGHSDLKTTEIYTHANGTNAVISPLDRPAPVKFDPIVDIREYFRTA